MTESRDVPTDGSKPSGPNGYSRWVGLVVAAIALAGVVLRAVVAYAAYPFHGDATFSYCYRAELIASGEFAGVFLMWHPPGYSSYLPVVAVGIGSYLAGVLVNLIVFVLLVVVVDRLVAARAWHPVTRLTAAAFVAFQETLFGIGGSPVTEPVYVLLIYSGLLLLIRPGEGVWRSGLAGLLFGVAITVRFEGVLLAAGVWFALACQWLRSRKDTNGQRWSVAAAFAVGVIVGCGWVFGNVSYVRACFESQQAAYTIPPASGVRYGCSRIQCGYHAMTAWLPQVLLLPFWIIVGGIGGPPPTREGRDGLALPVSRRSGHSRLCVDSHAQTNRFVPTSCGAVWFAVGIEYLAARIRPARPARRRLPLPSRSRS